MVAASNRQRRRLVAGAGRLKKKEISDDEVRAVLEAGDVPKGRHLECERWLRHTLDLCWMLERADTSNETKSEKIKRLNQFYNAVARVRNGIVDPWVLRHLMGARVLAQVVGKQPSESKAAIVEQRAKIWGRRI